MVALPEADIYEEIIKRKKSFKRMGLEKRFRLRLKDFVIKGDNDDNDDEDGKLIIEGFASTIDKDRVDDIIEMQALIKAKNQLLQPGANTVFFNHDRDMPIGKVIATKIVKGRGLKVRIRISMAGDVKDIRTKIREGVLTSLSIGGRFKRVRIERDEDGRIISFKVLEIELFEVSVVGLPANPKATITSVSGKSLEGWSKMLKSINSKTSSETDDKSGSTKMKNKKKKKAKKKVEKKDLPEDQDDDDEEDEDGSEAVTEKKVKELIKEAVSPLSKNMKELTKAVTSVVTTVKAISEAQTEEENDDDEDEDEDEGEEDEGKEKSKGKKKKGETLKSLSKSVSGLTKLVKSLKKDQKIRKGHEIEEDEEDEDEDSDDGTMPKKALKDSQDEDTQKYVGYMMDNPEKYKELTDTEKEKITELYMDMYLTVNAK